MSEAGPAAGEAPAAGDGAEKGTALITGATRGIGYELARLFAATGHDVALVARTESDLAETAAEFRERYGVATETVAVDLTEPDAPERVHEATTEAGMTVTTLVNNAGFGTAGDFHESPIDRDLDLVDLKVRAVTELTRRYLPEMRSDPRTARVLTVASASAFVPGPKMSVYYAANAYQRSFSESLAAEYADEDVTVTCLCPGPVATDFHERAGTDGRSTGLIPTPTMDPRTVARAGFRGLRRGEAVVVPGLTIRLLLVAASVVPGAVLRRAMRYYNRGL